jgi:predicted nuclease of predicted toxin-antitoxin system
LKFLVDMPVTPQAVAHLRSMGHEAVHASEVGLATSPDSKIVDRAQAEERVVITADLDYPRLLAELKTDRPGVILFRGGDYSEVEMLALPDRVLAQFGDADLVGSITVVDRQRVRRRVLPLTS